MENSTWLSRSCRGAAAVLALAALLAPAASSAAPCTALTCPANITADTDPGLCTTVVNYSPTATGDCVVVRTAGLPSGSEFPAGTTTNCFRDAQTLNISCCFNIAVKDVEAPTITCPRDQIGASGVVNYPPPEVMDNCGAVAVCVPASGSVFPLGETTVTCTANDGNPTTASCTFKVIVPHPAPAAGSLALAALVAGLTAGGAWLANRRRRSA